MTRPFPFRPNLTGSILVSAALLGACLLAAGPVAAHEGAGILTVEQSSPTGDLGVDYVVRLVWDNDGHPAADATVTATAVDPAGAPQTPVPLEPIDDDGRYQATVSFPAAGSWTVRFTSVTPPGTLETTTDVAAPVITAPGSDSTTAPLDDQAPTDGTAPDDAPETEAASAESDASDGNSWLLAAIVAVVFVVLAVGAVLALRARRSAGGT